MVKYGAEKDLFLVTSNHHSDAISHNRVRATQTVHTRSVDYYILNWSYIEAIIIHIRSH